MQDESVNDFSGTPCCAAEQKELHTSESNLFVWKGILACIASPLCKGVGFSRQGLFTKMIHLIRLLKML